MFYISVKMMFPIAFICIQYIDVAINELDKYLPEERQRFFFLML